MIVTRQILFFTILVAMPQLCAYHAAARTIAHEPTVVSIHSGNNQVAVVGSQLPQPLVVAVTDSAGNLLPGVEIVFAAVAGRTEPPTARVVSDAVGLARFQPRTLDYGALVFTAVTAQPQDQPIFFQGVTSGWTSTLAGAGIQAAGGDEGPAIEALFNAPFGMALQEQNLLVVDYFNHTLRRIDLNAGTIHRLAGTGKQGFNGDGLPALETVLNGPFGIAQTRRGEVVFSDYYNNRIRTLNAQTGEIATIAGIDSPGYSGDGGPGTEAKIDVPLDIATDSQGNVYLSDWHHHVVRKLDIRTGTIDTIAGTGARKYSGEGQARQAALAVPLGLSVDKHDNLYIADYGNNRIRKIDAKSGRISTVAGSGTMGYSGDGGPAVQARLNRPYNVYVDDQGDLFISDAGNHRVRHVNARSGIITTIAGQGEYGHSDDHRLAVDEPFMGPFSVITDDRGNLYIAEYFGHRIRQVGPRRQPLLPTETTRARLMRQARQVFGELPAVIAPTDKAGAARVALGRELFHEQRLSRDDSLSCASCHPLDQHGMDGLPVAKGIDDQLGPRNTPTVFNAALQDAQFWDARTETLETQALDPILNPIEMAMPNEAAIVAALRAIPKYHEQFAAAFPGDIKPINALNTRLALGAFQRQLLTPDAAIDRFMNGDEGALNEQELAGLKVFLREGCGSCHAGPLLGGQVLHLLHEYPDTRAGDRFEFRKRLGNAYKFKVAPLRNIATTAPYLHDGRYPDLEDSLGGRLIAYMVREASIRDTVELSDSEKTDLLAFLEALTSPLPPLYQH